MSHVTDRRKLKAAVGSNAKVQQVFNRYERIAAGQSELLLNGPAKLRDIRFPNALSSTLALFNGELMLFTV